MRALGDIGCFVCKSSEMHDGVDEWEVDMWSVWERRVLLRLSECQKLLETKCYLCRRCFAGDPLGHGIARLCVECGLDSAWLRQRSTFLVGSKDPRARCSRCDLCDCSAQCSGSGMAKQALGASTSSPPSPRAERKATVADTMCADDHDDGDDAVTGAPLENSPRISPRHR